jgi:trimethylamine--corrinoid protein Co-methyltransferase
MAAARLVAFSKHEEELVHQQSIRCLGEIGVLIKSESVQAQLSKAGAEVDKGTGVVKIPEAMVKEALRSAPKAFRLCGRNPEHDRDVPVKNHPLLATTGLAVYTTDLDAGERRPTTSKDLAAFSKMADAMSGVDICWTTVTAHDVVQDALAPHSLWVALQNNSKHVQVVPPSRGSRDASIQIDIAALVAGGRDELRKRPIFSVIMCPVAPLTFERNAVEAQAEFARAGIPIVCMSMSLSGMSSPVTLAGTIVNINSENLASLVISQLSSKGAPFIYSSESAPIDMTTGVMDYVAAEIPAINAGASQMAHRYGLPCMVSSWGTETKEPGIQASFSELAVTLVGNMVGSDLCSGAGSIDSAKGASLEQVVIDSYMWENCRTMMREFEVSEESIALEVTKAVGHGNTFLRHPHTARNFRRTIAFRDQKKKLWEATLSTKMAPEAREIAKGVLGRHEVPSVDPGVVRKAEALLKDYDKEVSGKSRRPF